MVMALYAALLYMPEGSDWMTPEVRAEHNVFGAAASEVIAGAAALYPTGSATTITVAGGPGGDVMVTDGPYAEATDPVPGTVGCRTARPAATGARGGAPDRDRVPRAQRGR